MAILRVMCVWLLLTAVVTVEAAKIETYNSASCAGAPTNTFYVNGNTCQTFNDQGAVQISDVSASTRVSIHNQKFCKSSSQVAQIYGPGCVGQGHTSLRAVWIQGWSIQYPRLCIHGYWSHQGAHTASVCKPIPKVHCMLANSQWLWVVMFGNILQDMTVYDCTRWTSCGASWENVLFYSIGHGY